MSTIAEIVTDARAGFAPAQAELIRRFRDYAYGRAYRVLGDHQRAEDVAQEAFAEAFACLDSLREPAAFPGWFKRILIKRIDRVTRVKSLDTLPLDELYSEPGEAPEESLDEENESTAFLAVALEALPEHEREPLYRYYYLGEAQQTIADAMGLPATTIKKRLYAARQRLKRAFADLGASPETELLTPTASLFAAAWHGYSNKVKRLLDEHPDLVSAVNDDGLGLLLYAAHAQHATGVDRVVRLLMAKNAPMDVHAAAALGHVSEIEQAFRDARGAWDRTPLHWAASGGHLALVEQLLAHGAAADVADQWGCTPLHLAAENGRLDVVQALLDAGADPRARLRNGKTPVHLAAQRGDFDVVEALLNRGAKLDVFAAASLGHEDFLGRLLRQERGQAHVRLPFGATPLHIAAEDGRERAAEYLVNHGAKLDLVSATELGWTSEIAAILRRDPGDVRAHSGSFGFTALHSATKRGRSELARLLLAKGAEVNATDRMYRKTPLGEALYYGNESMARLLFQYGARIGHG